MSLLRQQILRRLSRGPRDGFHMTVKCVRIVLERPSGLIHPDEHKPLFGIPILPRHADVVAILILAGGHHIHLLAGGEVVVQVELLVVVVVVVVVVVGLVLQHDDADDHDDDGDSDHDDVH